MGADGMEGATRSTIPSSGIIPAPFLSYRVTGNGYPLRVLRGVGDPFSRCRAFHFSVSFIRADYVPRVVGF